MLESSTSRHNTGDNSWHCDKYQRPASNEAETVNGAAREAMDEASSETPLQAADGSDGESAGNFAGCEPRSAPLAAGQSERLVGLHFCSECRYFTPPIKNFRSHRKSNCYHSVPPICTTCQSKSSL